MKLRSDGWYEADEGKYFVLTEKGKQECASYKHKTVGKPVDRYDYEAVGWSVEKGYVEEVPNPNWIEKVGYVVVYGNNGYELPAGNYTVFPEKWMAEKYMKHYQSYPWMDKELYIKEAVYKGEKQTEPIYHDGKQVYDDSWYFGCAALEIGDYVTEDIVDDMINCLPPACMRSDCSQCGEPVNHMIDEKTGKERPTYTTFRKVAENVWEYRGDCFRGENEQRGMEIPMV